MSDCSRFEIVRAFRLALLSGTVLAAGMVGAASAQTTTPIPAPPVAASDAPPANRARTDGSVDQNDPDSVQEVVVTARQRNETLLSVPVAVTAVSGQTLANFGATDVRDIVKLAPSLLLDRGGSAAGGTVALRGVSTSPGQAGFDQAVSIYVDGVQTARPRILAQGLFDIDQVEVLKGPQALFFGKNSPGGVLSIKTAGPTDHLTGYARASYEFVANEKIVEGAIAGPLGEDFGARLAIRYRDMDGWLRNTAGAFTPATYRFSSGVPQAGRPASDPGVATLGVRRPGQEELLGRLTLAYKPAGSAFDATLKLSGSDYKDDGPSAGTQLFWCGGRTSGLTYGALDPFGDCALNRNYSASALPDGVANNWPYARQQPYQKTRVYLGSLTANYRFDNLTLTSVSGIFKLSNSSLDNYDATAFMQLAAAEHESFRSISQELRLLSSFDSPVNFLLGGFYQDTNLDFINSSKILALGSDPATGKYQTWEKPSGTDGKTYSAFGQLIWDVVQQVEFAAGVRFTHEAKDSFLLNRYVHPPLSGTAFSPPTRTLTDRFRDNNWSPEVTLTWRPTSDVTAYAAYKTGYKSGGFGLSAVLTPANISEAAIRFDSEQVKGFEGGLKAQVLDRKLTFTSAIYSYKYSNLQVNSFNPATTSFTITNAAAARVKGAEAEINFRPIKAVTLFGALAYNHARYIDFRTSCYGGQNAALGCNVRLSAGADGIAGNADDPIGQSLAGRPLARAPNLSANAGFNVNVPVSASWLVGLDGNARYSSRYFISENGNAAGIQPSYWVLDAGVRLRSEDSRYQIALLGRNLTNEYYATFGQDKPGADATPGIPVQISAAPSRGRQVSLELTYRY